MRARRCETFLIERAPRTLKVEILVRRRGGVWRASSLARNSKCAIHNKFVLLLLFVSWLGQLFVSAFPITWIPVSVGVIRKRRTIPERDAETQFLLWTFLLVCALSHRMPMPKISAQRALFTPDQWLLVAPTNAVATETRSTSLWSIFYQSPKVVLACFSTAMTINLRTALFVTGVHYSWAKRKLLIAQLLLWIGKSHSCGSQFWICFILKLIFRDIIVQTNSWKTNN